ncbi:ABC transporter permease [Prosthecodimorpha hirschii]|uniref:ABC transporter permease n=1 Tax=Prosthecodimorpha hirschii TaxID=665126 RepID=UPI001FEF937F|nr:ABC transporter permease [Prosthecomicrobium hirschii]
MAVFIAERPPAAPGITTEPARPVAETPLAIASRAAASPAAAAMPASAIPSAGTPVALSAGPAAWHSPPPSRPRRASGRRFVLDLALVLVALVAIWWSVVLVLAPEPFLLPGPDRVVLALIRRWGDLWPNALVTLTEILIGLVTGIVAGVATALFMGYVPAASRVVTPFVVVLQSMPVFAIAPVLVLWFGFGLASKIVMATVIIFFPVASAFHDGIERTDPGLLDLARLYGAGRARTLALIQVPAALPALVTGLRMAAAVAPIGAIVGEWVGASSGLGLIMMHANARMQTDVMFAALALVVAMAVILRLAADLLADRLLPWLDETDR